MSALEIAIIKLTATSAVTAIVGTRVFPIEAIQNASMPYVVVNLVSGYDNQLLTGAGGYYCHRVTVECIAADALAVRNLGNAVMTALADNVNATIGSFAGVATRFGDVDRTDSANERLAKRRTLDFFIHWRN